MDFLKNPKYEIAPVLSFIEKNILLKLIEDGTVWGYNIPVSSDRSDGSASKKTAIAATKNHDYELSGFFYHMLLDDLKNIKNCEREKKFPFLNSFFLFFL